MVGTSQLIKTLIGTSTVTYPRDIKSINSIQARAEHNAQGKSQTFSIKLKKQETRQYPQV